MMKKAVLPPLASPFEDSPTHAAFCAPGMETLVAALCSPADRDALPPVTLALRYAQLASRLNTAQRQEAPLDVVQQMPAELRDPVALLRRARDVDPGCALAALGLYSLTKDAAVLANVDPATDAGVYHARLTRELNEQQKQQGDLIDATVTIGAVTADIAAHLSSLIALDEHRPESWDLAAVVMAQKTRRVFTGLTNAASAAQREVVNTAATQEARAAALKALNDAAEAALQNAERPSATIHGATYTDVMLRARRLELHLREAAVFGDTVVSAASFFGGPLPAEPPFRRAMVSTAARAVSEVLLPGEAVEMSRAERGADGSVVVAPAVLDDAALFGIALEAFPRNAGLWGGLATAVASSGRRTVTVLGEELSWLECSVRGLEEDVCSGEGWDLLLRLTLAAHDTGAFDGVVEMGQPCVTVLGHLLPAPCMHWLAENAPPSADAFRAIAPMLLKKFREDCRPSVGPVAWCRQNPASAAALLAGVVAAVAAAAVVVKRRRI